MNSMKCPHCKGEVIPYGLGDLGYCFKCKGNCKTVWIDAESKEQREWFASNYGEE